MKLNHIISLMICLSILVLPVSATYIVTGGNIDLENTIHADNTQVFTYTTNPGEKISIIEFDLPLNTVVNFTLYYGTGSTVSGWAIYQPYLVFGKSYSEVAIDTSVYSETFLDAQAAGYSVTKHVEFTSYARNSTGQDDAGFAIYAQGYGLFSNEIAYYHVPDLQNNLIYRVDFTSTNPLSFTIDTAREEVLGDYVYTTVSESVETGWTGSVLGLVGYVGLIWGVFSSLFFWLEFIFIKNLVLTTCLYISGTMGYCAMTSRNVFEFYKKFFRLQRSIFEFAAGAFNVLVQMITAVINALKPV